MVKVIGKANAYTTVVAIKTGDLFYSTGLIPEGVDDYVRMDRIAMGWRMMAKKDLVIVVEGLWSDPCTGADHIFFIRADRAKENTGSLRFAKFHPIRHLREALIYANMPRMEAIGGFDRALVYDDELAVPDASFGPYGWIIQRDDIARYLEKFGGDSGRFERITIWHEIHLNRNREYYPVIRIEGWSEPPMKDDVTILSTTEYIVLFDAESRIVQRITMTSADIAGISCDRAPLRSVAIGKRLPPSLARK